MYQRLEEITGTIETASRELEEAYQRESLHAFRVGSRRIRSLLKRIGSHRARGLRKAWGGFAARTGPARDWDVFLETADELLDTDARDEFRRRNAAAIQASRDAVIEMIRSATWCRHLVEWRAYLDRIGRQDVSGLPRDPTLDEALGAARAALAAALLEETDSQWHQFRIAVKELRYTAEAHPAESGSDHVIDTCKHIQTLLGDWHDTVVQLGLLEELPRSSGNRLLTRLIGTRQQERLAEIHAAIDKDRLFSLPVS